jgi:TRAP-type mannitol/chloroaromatic compound transport system substrate-binding protein
MDRRTFLRAAGLSSVAAATLPAPGIAQSRTELQLVMPWPRDFPGLGTSVQRLADRISALTEGRIAINVHAAGELVPTLEEFAAVADGRADLYHAPDYYYAGNHPALAYFTNAPLGLTAIEHTAWIELAGGQQLWDELSGQFGIKPLLAGNTGTQMAGWFKQPIESVSDLDGLNFRMPGLGGEVWRQLGMNVINLPGAAILGALQSGELDGTDWVGPWNDLAWGFQQYAKHYYYPSLVEGCGALALGINRGVWDKMSAGDQTIFHSACQAENALSLSDYRLNNGRSLAILETDHTVMIERFPADIIDAVGAVSPGIAASAAVGEIGSRIYESYLDAREAMRNWTAISEPNYVAERARILG